MVCEKTMVMALLQPKNMILFGDYNRETGKDWHESNWKDGRDPRTLQVGEKIDMGIHSEKPDDAPEINNNSEAEKLYNDGSWERIADGI
jgi:hypothetical protein